MSTWAKPGVKCVFIGTKLHMAPGAVRAGCSLPPTGAVFTVSATRMHLGHLYLGLVEYHQDAWITVTAFRPITTRTQSEDVALFRKLLVTEGADA